MPFPQLPPAAEVLRQVVEELHVPDTADHVLLLWQVEVGAPVNPVLQVAVHVRLTALEAPQLKAPLAGLGGFPLQPPLGVLVHEPLRELHSPLLWQVEVGAPENPLLQVAVHMRPTGLEAPQLKNPLAGLGGLPAQVVVVPVIMMSAQSAKDKAGRRQQRAIRHEQQRTAAALQQRAEREKGNIC